MNNLRIKTKQNRKTMIQIVYMYTPIIQTMIIWLPCSLHQTSSLVIKGSIGSRIALHRIELISILAEVFGLTNIIHYAFLNETMNNLEPRGVDSRIGTEVRTMRYLLLLSLCGLTGFHCSIKHIFIL